MRLVSLCPSLTETLFRLGLGASLVGRTKFCVEPHGAIEAVERVSGTKNPKLERIVALRPDLVLMNEEENRREDAEALRAAQISVLSTFAKDVPGAIESVRQLGRAIGAEGQALQLAQALEQRADEVATRAMQRPKVRFAYLIWRKPYMAAARGTYIDGLLSLAGGENVVADPGSRYPEIDTAALDHADAILLSSEPFPFTSRHREELHEETAIPAARIHLVDGQQLSWHGARTLEGLAYAERLFIRATAIASGGDQPLP
jgi:ABC-type Fe3+-hydroxamate transport system substrate-binding protein